MIYDLYPKYPITTSCHISQIYHPFKRYQSVARDVLKLFVIVCQEFVGVVTYSRRVSDIKLMRAVNLPPDTQIWIPCGLSLAPGLFTSSLRLQQIRIRALSYALLSKWPLFRWEGVKGLNFSRFLTRFAAFWSNDSHHPNFLFTGNTDTARSAEREAEMTL